MKNWPCNKEQAVKYHDPKITVTPETRKMRYMCKLLAQTCQSIKALQTEFRIHCKIDIKWTEDNMYYLPSHLRADVMRKTEKKKR